MGFYVLMLYKALSRLKQSTVPLNFGRIIIANWCSNLIRPGQEVNILDIGMGPGTDLLNIKNSLLKKYPDSKISLYGLDSYLPSLERAKNLGIEGKPCNIESEPFPYPDQFFDFIVANQVIEHTKDIFWIYSEISRVLKPEGYIITGVPNLASFHNRIALLFGQQPTCSELLGPHVRSITAGSFITFIEADGYFKNIATKGSNFYPFPAFISKVLSKLFPRAAVSIFFLTQRTQKPGLFKEVLASRFFETNYYVGP